MTEADVFQALRSRYPEDAYVLLPHVRDGTGVHACRTADALAFGLWPSRGLEIEGFEIKCSRNDWLRELKSPEKADAIYGYCDRWWLVVSDADYVKENELPPTWGLLVMKGNGLHCKAKAPKLTPHELDRSMFFSVLRKLQKEVTPNKLIEPQIKAAREQGKRMTEMGSGNVQRELDRLQASLEQFEKMSGVKIDGWNGGRIGEAVKLVMANTHKNAIQELKTLRHRLTYYVDRITTDLTDIEGSVPSEDK